MSGVRVKICGLVSPEDALAAVLNETGRVSWEAPFTEGTIQLYGCEYNED